MMSKALIKIFFNRPSLPCDFCEALYFMASIFSVIISSIMRSFDSEACGIFRFVRKFELRITFCSDSVTNCVDRAVLIRCMQSLS